MPIPGNSESKKEKWAPAPSARAPQDQPILLLCEPLGLIWEQEQVKTPFEQWVGEAEAGGKGGGEGEGSFLGPPWARLHSQAGRGKEAVGPLTRCGPGGARQVTGPGPVSSATVRTPRPGSAPEPGSSAPAAPPAGAAPPPDGAPEPAAPARAHAPGVGGGSQVSVSPAPAKQA